MAKNKKALFVGKSVLLLLTFFIFNSSELDAAVQTYNITAYFTKFYIRENVNDMPRVNYMLIQADGACTPLSFNKYTAKNGTYSRWNFDQDEYLGKTVRIEFTGTPQQNNQEYPIYINSVLTLLDRIVVAEVKSISVASTSINVDSKYSYPQADTLLIPHDVLVEKESYNDEAPTGSVNLADYVTGAGTESDPYVSSDNTAGMNAAVKALPDGGTILVAPGVYKATKNGTKISRFVEMFF